MEPNTLINALNEVIVIYRKTLQNYTHYRYIFIIINIIKYQGWLLGNHIYVKNIP